MTFISDTVVTYTKTVNQAVFSPDRIYRYTLWRMADRSRPRPYVNFICLNPSTADEIRDDNTVYKCTKYARAWGNYDLCVTNVFAYRSTDPVAMKRHAEPIGIHNDMYISEIARGAAIVVAAWGAHARHLDRSRAVLDLLQGVPLYALRIGKFEPYHPLYLPDALEPFAWEPAL